MPIQAPARYRITHRGWDEPETAPAMANQEDRRSNFALTSRHITRNGAPWIPVTGELHYSRQPRRRWRDALRLMKAGGITVVATYVFWIHHQENEGDTPDFTGNRDLAAFVGLCDEIGLEVILRIGPWCHGEVRNGGHPDWVVKGNYPERTDDPAYLNAVRDWFTHIGREVGNLCGPDGPVIGIQLENELYDQREHIRTLKDIARKCGLHAPLWTATAWGNADIPVGDVFPLYGGYSDGFWVDTDDGWHEGFRMQFAFSHQWDDPGIGKDLAGENWTGVVGGKHPEFPAATCELGGGMAAAYHRRPNPSARDTAAVAHCKLGSGSAWQGYYMFVGGTNPTGLTPLQESHATGYPNDLPELNYDFGAPIGSHLQIREIFHRLRNQHSFLASFGSDLARMNMTLPDNAAVDELRYALRSDGQTGFLFINNHRPFESLPPQNDVQFDIELEDRNVKLPHRPIDIPSGEFMAWPLELEVDGIIIRWATLSLLTLLKPAGELPVLVLIANDGVEAHLAVPTGCTVSGHEDLTFGADEIVLENIDSTRGFITVTDMRDQGLRLLVLKASEALHAWTLTVDGQPRLIHSAAGLMEHDGALSALTSGREQVSVYPPLGAAAEDGFSHHEVGTDAEAPKVHIVQHTEPLAPPPHRITVPGRASAPDPETFSAHAARYTVHITGPALASERSLLRLQIVGDIAKASFGQRNEDVFWNGSDWEIDITPPEDTAYRVVEVAVYPLDADTPAWLPETAEGTRALLKGPTATISSASVITFTSSKVERSHRRTVNV